MALEHVAETLDELLPDREANDAIFRLAVSVLHQLRAGSIWMPLTYFQLWLVRLVGFLARVGRMSGLRAALNGSGAFYHALADGVMCSARSMIVVETGSSSASAARPKAPPIAPEVQASPE